MNSVTENARTGGRFACVIPELPGGNSDVRVEPGLPETLLQARSNQVALTDALARVLELSVSGIEDSGWPKPCRSSRAARSRSGWATVVANLAQLSASPRLWEPEPSFRSRFPRGGERPLDRFLPRLRNHADRCCTELRYVRRLATRSSHAVLRCRAPKRRQALASCGVDLNHMGELHRGPGRLLHRFVHRFDPSAVALIGGGDLERS